MSAAVVTIDDPFEAMVLERAQQNFLDNGPGNKMWADPSSMKGSALSTCFTLSVTERSAFIAVARAEIEIETGQPCLAQMAESAAKVQS